MFCFLPVEFQFQQSVLSELPSCCFDPRIVRPAAVSKVEYEPHASIKWDGFWSENAKYSENKKKCIQLSLCAYNSVKSPE